MIEYISRLCKRISNFFRGESVYYAPASKIKEWSSGILDRGIWKYFDKHFFPGGVEFTIKDREGLNNYRTAEPRQTLSKGPTLSDTTEIFSKGLEEKISGIKEGFDRAMDYLNSLSSEAFSKINLFEFSFSPKYSEWDFHNYTDKVNFRFGY